MAIKDLREWLEVLEKEGELARTKTKVDWNLELGGITQEVFDREGVALILPEAEEQAYIHDKYMNELVQGVILPETRERLLVIVDRLKAQENIEGLILGGTELPLILREETYSGIPFLNTTKIHVERAVAQMLS